MSSSLLVLVLALGLAQEKPPGLHKQKEIVLEGSGSFDYVNVDPDSGLLYVGHAPKIDVVDPAKGVKIGQVDGVDGAHGAIAIGELKRGYATAGQKNRLVVFDLSTLKVLKEVETGQNPDALLYVPALKEVWTFNGRAKSITCVDAATLEVTATIPLQGKPEAAVDHAEKGLVYVNLEDKSAIAVIDSRKHAVLSTHGIAPGEEPTGLALDAKNGLLFAGCGNKRLVAIEIATWKVAGSVDIGEHCDGVAFDPANDNVYASCRDKTGGLHVKDGTTFLPLAALDTPGGKTCDVNPKTHELFITSGPPRGQKGEIKVSVYAP